MRKLQADNGDDVSAAAADNGKSYEIISSDNINIVAIILISSRISAQSTGRWW